jgi:hypothetical protein
MRADQIKIIKKEDLISKITDFYKIAKQNNITNNFGKYYREGVLGGVPIIYEEFE